MKTEQQKEQQKAKELRQAKREAIKIAGELGYLYKFKGIDEDIKNAKSIPEVTRIMTTCRKAS